ncbi:hypothetical protein DFJ74DRAFT_728972 [Hyaloraphidium curvatum]|nr:hypothetical protein DFJ74DRAFT_728972 [Hyaloraphidium curvatum]
MPRDPGPAAGDRRRLPGTADPLSRPLTRAAVDVLRPALRRFGRHAGDPVASALATELALHRPRGANGGEPASRTGPPTVTPCSPAPFPLLDLPPELAPRPLDYLQPADLLRLAAAAPQLRGPCASRALKHVLPFLRSEFAARAAILLAEHRVGWEVAAGLAGRVARTIAADPGAAGCALFRAYGAAWSRAHAVQADFEAKWNSLVAEFKAAGAVVGEMGVILGPGWIDAEVVLWDDAIPGYGIQAAGGIGLGSAADGQSDFGTAFAAATGLGGSLEPAGPDPIAPLGTVC